MLSTIFVKGAASHLPNVALYGFIILTLHAISKAPSDSHELPILGYVMWLCLSGCSRRNNRKGSPILALIPVVDN